MGKRRVAYRDLVLKPEGRRPLGKPRRRWKDNIKMILERGSNSVHTVHGARPASYTIPTRSFSLGSNGQGAALTTQHRLELGLKKSRTVLLIPLWDFMACSRVNFTFTYN